MLRAFWSSPAILSEVSYIYRHLKNSCSTTLQATYLLVHCTFGFLRFNLGLRWLMVEYGSAPKKWSIFILLGIKLVKRWIPPWFTPSLGVKTPGPVAARLGRRREVHLRGAQLSDGGGSAGRVLCGAAGDLSERHGLRGPRQGGGRWDGGW